MNGHYKTAHITLHSQRSVGGIFIEIVRIRLETSIGGAMLLPSFLIEALL
jgi:hypothetical protein